jgi:ornithine cyclodeaminase/alanine dehydrogenase-like protein (mu-crystallin family)
MTAGFTGGVGVIVLIVIIATVDYNYDTMPLLLSEQDVRIVLSMDDLISTMEGALAQFSSGAVQQPLRTVLQLGPQHAFFGVMPASTGAPAALGTKLVTVFGSNTAVGLPTHLATIVLLDPSTGELLAVMDGRYHRARTAAVSAVSAKLPRATRRRCWRLSGPACRHGATSRRLRGYAG